MASGIATYSSLAGPGMARNDIFGQLALPPNEKLLFLCFWALAGPQINIFNITGPVAAPQFVKFRFSGSLAGPKLKFLMNFARWPAP